MFTPETETASPPETVGRAAVPVDPSPAAPRPRPSAGTRLYGSLEVVDLDRSRPLRTQLGEIVHRSRGRTVLLQTYVRSSAACAAIAASLPDARMQHALANVTIVLVDAEDYDHELDVLRVETRTAPWFYRLDAKAGPTDAMSADGWDDYVPEAMAPVLARFAHRVPARPAR
jgi:hypothetical protein